MFIYERAFPPPPIKFSSTLKAIQRIKGLLADLQYEE